ncbi:cystathionine gamma-synthase [Thermopolyspora flexuosa]|jgi:methionine-gamma-lyase|uniref:homocysteine desulfhydrase n=1 Tax=Thermopolyspora flexuosa TaxID=103836 RepID=A0A543IYP0_9ACTN|nr:aminotransferase class I/II-fold pyridoxal phosphate-dependent enzyme [Thermopolyspora flexuosa]TQM75699.1 cystathionine gamma-synthase [Thermopolyspora flexuosa]GGM61359.1 cystathionine gamma-synthase [Thermopolyspora flexuosa]
MDDSFTLETLLLHADADDDAEPGIAPPIHASVPFSAATAEEFAELSAEPRHERFYRRYGNPTQARLERLIAEAEGAEAALATASGMGAVSTTLLTLLSAGDHVVAQHSMYGGTLGFLRDVAPRLGIEVTFVDQADTPAFARALRPNTRLVMLETPSNPLLRVTDLRAVAELARDRGILTMADNTVATPVNQRPLECGVDLVMHSVTKSLSGHSDVLAGIVAGSRELIERIWQTHILVGAVVSPYDAWLALRGLRTLVMRVERQNAGALALARFLQAHPGVAAVNHPGLPEHPQHGLAVRQMRGFGGLLSFEPHGGREAAERLLSALRLVRRSPSLGGYRTLAVRPAAMWALELSDEELTEAGVPPALIRVAVGLENPDDLVADFERALAAAGAA